MKLRLIQLLAVLLLGVGAQAQPYISYSQQVADSISNYSEYAHRTQAVLKIRDLVAQYMRADSAALMQEAAEIEAQANQKKQQADSLSHYLSLLSFNENTGTTPAPSDTVIIPAPEPVDTIVRPSGTYVNRAGIEKNNDCTPWKRVRTGDVELENNVWGTNGDSRYKSCLITEPDSSYGWTWSTPSGLNNNVKMYLQSVIGHKPFFHYTLGKGFPFSANEVVDFKASFKSETTASGKYNLAFEFWTVKEYHSDDEYINKTRAGGNNITGEYMFWMQAHFGMPVSHRNQVIDGRTWNVTVGGSDQLYVAFIPADGVDITEATIDFMPFLEWLKDHDLLDPNEKIVSLEFGNEVIEGSGKTIIRDYTVAITKEERSSIFNRFRK